MEHPQRARNQHWFMQIFVEIYIHILMILLTDVPGLLFCWKIILLEWICVGKASWTLSWCWGWWYLCPSFMLLRRPILMFHAQIGHHILIFNDDPFLYLASEWNQRKHSLFYPQIPAFSWPNQTRSLTFGFCLSSPQRAAILSLLTFSSLKRVKRMKQLKPSNSRNSPRFWSLEPSFCCLFSFNSFLFFLLFKSSQCISLDFHRNNTHCSVLARP